MRNDLEDTACEYHSVCDVNGVFHITAQSLPQFAEIRSLICGNWVFGAAVVGREREVVREELIAVWRTVY